MPGDSLCAGAQGDTSFEIAGGINLVGNLPPVTVEVLLARAPARGVPLRHDAVDAIRCEETVINALLEAVLIDRVAEIQIGVAVLIAQRRRGHAELIGGREVFENFAPVGIVLRAAAMTLVHDDEIEEIGSELLVKAGTV